MKGIGGLVKHCQVAQLTDSYVEKTGTYYSRTAIQNTPYLVKGSHMLWRFNVLVYFASLITSRALDAYETSLINSLRTKINLNYILKSQLVPRSEHIPRL